MLDAFGRVIYDGCDRKRKGGVIMLKTHIVVNNICGHEFELIAMHIDLLNKLFFTKIDYRHCDDGSYEIDYRNSEIIDRHIDKFLENMNQIVPIEVVKTEREE